MKKLNSLKALLGVAFLLLLSVSVHAQFLRTSYFMEGVGSRLQLNPAFMPMRGYVYVPSLGSLNAGVTTNGFGIKDAIECFDTGDDFYHNDELFKRLKSMNKLSLTVGSDIISFGFFKGKGFWSFNAGVRTAVDASVPKSMFEQVRDVQLMSQENNWNWGSLPTVQDQRLKGLVYTEIGVGYSRIINKRLTVGAKVKALLGLANLDMQVNHLAIQANMPGNIEDFNPAIHNASIKAEATFEGNMRGLETTETETYNMDGSYDEPYIDGVKLKSFGVAGYGASFDLGASFKVMKYLTVSASLLDMGWISWSKSASVGASIHENKIYTEENAQDFYERLGEGDIIDFDMLRMRDDESLKKARTTRMPMTLALGAELGLLTNKLSVGALYTQRWGILHNLSELTLSANWRPNRTIGVSGSYSMIQSGGKSFGAAIKLGPLFVGTDYLYLGNNTRSVNAMIGLSFGIGKTKKEMVNANNLEWM